MSEDANQVDPVAIFESLTLESIDKAIHDVETEIKQFIEPRTRRLDSLKACRRAVEIRENGAFFRKPRKVRTPKKKSSRDDDDDRSSTSSSVLSISRILTLLRVTGPSKAESIASQLNIDCNDELREMLSDTRYFKKEPYNKYSALS